jgi:preprotein translocase subunit SecG
MAHSFNNALREVQGGNVMLKKITIFIFVLFLTPSFIFKVFNLFEETQVESSTINNDEFERYKEQSGSIQEKFKKRKISKKVNTALKERGLVEEAQCSIIGSEHHFIIEARISPEKIREEDREEIQLVINEILIMNGYKATNFNVYIMEGNEQ